MLNTPGAHEGAGISAPLAEYADYPEAHATHATPTQPPVSQPEPSAVAAQTPAPAVTDNVGVRSVVNDESLAELAASTTAVAKTSAHVVAAVELRTDNSVEDNPWHTILEQLKLGGMAQQLAEHCLFKSQAGGKVVLLLERSGETLLTTRTEQALTEALQQHFSEPVQPEFEVTETIGETPEKRRIRLGEERQAAAEQAIVDDPVIQQIKQKWGGVVIPGSVRPNKDVDTS